MSIIIVDDEKEIADLVDVVLKNEGYETIKFYDSSDAYKEIQTNSFEGLCIVPCQLSLKKLLYSFSTANVVTKLGHLEK